MFAYLVFPKSHLEISYLVEQKCKQVKGCDGKTGNKVLSWRAVGRAGGYQWDERWKNRKLFIRIDICANSL